MPILLVLLLITIGVAGVRVWDNKQNKNKSTITEHRATEDKLLQSSEEEIKEYVNNDIGFKFYYPSGWKPEFNIGPIESTTISKLLYGPGLKYSLDHNAWISAETDKTLEIYKNNPEGKIYTDIESVVNKNSVEVWDFAFGDAGHSQSNLTFIKDGKVIEIVLPIFCSESYCGYCEDEVSATDKNLEKLNLLRDSIAFF